MAEYTQHEPGTFSWYELATTDQAAAKAYYTELFGWSFRDNPMGPDAYYTMFTLNGKLVGAAFKEDPEQAEAPPHWRTYITVANIDESAAKAEALGGKVIHPPFDVMDAGRMAWLRDPTGAGFALWQANKHIGAEIAGEAGSAVWNELMTTDTDAATKFYTELFGWTAKAQDMGTMIYTVFSKGETMVGGMMKIGPEMGGAPPHWMNYFGTADCDATVERSQRAGGKTIVPPTDIPGVGRFAVLSDPQGAAFAVLKFAMPG